MHDLMLLFLSNVKFSADTKKISSVKYSDISVATETTNESAVRYLVEKKGIKLEQLFYFVTQTVQADISGTENVAGEKTTVFYYDENGNKCTHEEHFLHRINDIVPDAAAHKTPLPFNEDEEAGAALGTVVRMAEEILSYIDKHVPAGEKVRLHADFTGGMRHAGLVMLVLMRLLQFNPDIEVGHVLYSNYQKKRVEEADDIYRLFNLVAGAEEFVNFGSVQSLEKYFSDTKSDQLKILIKAMHGFCEEIRLSHRGRFKQAAEMLRQAVQHFHLENEPDADLKMMAVLLRRIRAEYKGILLADELKDEDLISWCVEHGYLQQAMTLFVECVPEAMVQKGLVCWTEKGKEIILQAKDEGGLRTSELSDDFYLLTVYPQEREEWEKAFKGKVETAAANVRNCYLKLLKDGLARKSFEAEPFLAEVNGLLNDSCMLSNKARLSERLKLWEHWQNDFVALKNERTAPFLLELKRLYLKKEGEQKAAAFDKLYGGQKYNKLKNMFTNLGREELLPLLSDVRPSYSAAFLQLAEEGLVEIRTDKRLVKDILDIYGIIKNERNSSAHARKDANPMAVAELSALLQEALHKLK